MAADRSHWYGSPIALAPTIALASLATGQAALSDEIDNTTASNGFEFLNLYLTVTPASAPSASVPSLQAAIIYACDDVPNYETYTLTSPENDRVVGIRRVSTVNAIKYVAFPLIQVHRRKFKIAIVNQLGVSFASSGNSLVAIGNFLSIGD